MPDFIEDYEAPDLTPGERARRICDAIYHGMKKMGHITTCHYDAGIPILERAIEAVMRDCKKEAK